MDKTYLVTSICVPESKFKKLKYFILELQKVMDRYEFIIRIKHS